MTSAYDVHAPSVLVIGESLMDVVRSGAREFRRPGGSPMNVAIGLSRLGVETHLLTRIGDDADGQTIKRHLVGAGVNVLDESIDSARTSTSTATIEPNGSANYSFDVDWRLASFTRPHPTRWIHVGSIATFLAPGADSLERLLQALKENKVISYDPNIRPGLMRNHHQAVDRFERFASLATVVKLSDEDAAWLYPALSEEFVIDRILGLGPEIVALTRGPNGAVVANQDCAVSVPAPIVTVVDTIGAGDSFMSSLIRELIGTDIPPRRGKDLQRIAGRSVFAASLTCTRVGAEPPTADEMRAKVGLQTEQTKRAQRTDSRLPLRDDWRA